MKTSRLQPPVATLRVKIMNRRHFSSTALALVVALWSTCSAEAADTPLQAGGVKGGLVVHLGCGNRAVPAALKPNDAYVVHALDTDADKVRQARERFLAGNFDGAVSAAVFDGRHLPYIDNLVNLLVVDSPFDVSQVELMRVIVPGGVLLQRDAASWKKSVKPVPAAMDDWTHYLNGPDNNAVSKDSAIKAPIRHLQWKGGPKYSRHHDKSSSIPAVVTTGGRLFYIVDEGPRASILWDSDWQLVARDAFNGVILWRKKIDRWTDQLWPLKSGPSKAPRRLVAAGDAVYVTLGLLSPVSKLDAATGEELRVYPATEKTEEILLRDGVLYLVVHPTIDANQRGGFWQRTPKRVMAVKESDGTVLWEHELPWIAPVTLTVGEENVYLCTGPRIAAFKRESGRRLWQSEELPWREKLPTYFAPTLVTAGNNVLYAGGENWREHAGSRGLLTCLDAATGKIKWQQLHLPSGYQSPQDIFVIDGRVWCGSLNSKPGEFDRRYPDVAPSTGQFISYDLETGKPERTIPRGADCYWFHHRCHRAKATVDFFLTSRTGIEMIDTHTGQWHLHHWVRGACLYGILPANGLIYAPPHPCACYPEAKLSGLNALAGTRSFGAPVPQNADRLEKGPAYSGIRDQGAGIRGQGAAGRRRGAEITREGRAPARGADWLTFRGDAARSGSTTTAVDEDVGLRWQTRIGGKLSQPIVAAGQVFLAAVDAHTVYAISQATGEIRWKFIAGGRVDSPPTFHRGTVVFGSRDGYVYCLRASDGLVAWRFLAAPRDQRLMACEQLESVWPVHGSVLVRDDVAYAVAGRSMFLDGGLVLYRLNPTTGEILSQQRMDGNDPNTGQDFHEHVTMLDMPVASSDILSSQRDYIFMRSQPFDLQGRRERVQHVPLGQQRGEDAHLFVPNGFLDDNYCHRAFWVYGRSVQGGPGYSATGHSAPSGKIMVLDDDTVYVFGRQQKYWRWTVPTQYRLFSVDRNLPRPGPNQPHGTKAAFATRWEASLPILARAMVKAGDTVFACGPAAVVNEPQFALRRPDQLEQLAEQAALYAGSDGSVLCGVSATDGAKLFQKKLDVLPVFDGLIAANGELYMSTVDGKVVCLGR